MHMCSGPGQYRSDRQDAAQVDVMVTAGANQAFVNILLTLTDASDPVVLYKPFYFNHLMAVQMTGGSRTVLFGPPTEGLKPDLDWLEELLNSEKAPKMVVIVNPCNPAGVHDTVGAFGIIE
jgi:aromatic aminotransferase